MTPASESRLNKVHPELARRVRMLIDTFAQTGVQIEVVQGLRTFAEQDALFAQGRSRPGQVVTRARGGQSNHNYGLAIDVVPYANGKPNWNAPNSIWSAIGAEAEKLGLEWGGDWKRFIDRPHVQLPGLTIKQCFVLFKKGGLEAVWAAASRLMRPLPVATTVPPAPAPTAAATEIPTPPEGAPVVAIPAVIVAPASVAATATVIPESTVAQPAPPPPRVAGRAGGGGSGVKLNERGESVFLIQTRLAVLGFLTHGDVDGIYGKGTQAAIKKFQKSKKLAADGVVGPNTRLALMS
jgi:D-alanyl-D-alanine carboxypeptidase/Putative peptidoglycan binding domain